MVAPAHRTRRFYELYDKNRQGLLEVYTDFSFFSLTTGALERLSEKEKQKNLSEYLQASRNLLKVRAQVYTSDVHSGLIVTVPFTYAGGGHGAEGGAPADRAREYRASAVHFAGLASSARTLHGRLLHAPTSRDPADHGCERARTLLGRYA
jgi:hypothetical protein